MCIPEKHPVHDNAGPNAGTKVASQQLLEEAYAEHPLAYLDYSFLLNRFPFVISGIFWIVVSGATKEGGVGDQEGESVGGYGK